MGTPEQEQGLLVNQTVLQDLIKHQSGDLVTFCLNKRAWEHVRKLPSCSYSPYELRNHALVWVPVTKAFEKNGNDLSILDEFELNLRQYCFK
ncbi:hypothetical protein Ciccas_004239 [Cichlidogyrus casuarinus]|uniref:Uncharacterized protein n=1 Tax=Cichlidogyrus casuarinus TaxID=1844966 RepID=A0ABD2QC62_9PLAT